MSTFFCAIGVMLLFLTSLYGSGRAVGEVLRLDVGRFPAYTVALGIVSWIFVGGIVNIAGVATFSVLCIVWLAGVVLAFYYLSVTIRGLSKEATFNPCRVSSGATQQPGLALWMAGLAIAVLLSAVVFLAATIMPTTALNGHDDFHTYLVRPVRMLSSGTLGGNPFDYLGTDSWGAQSFMQGFIVTLFPLEYVNGYDAVFCFALTGWLLIELGRNLKLQWGYIIIGLCVFMAINPLYVNTTALYSGSLMILALAQAAGSLVRTLDENDRALLLRRSVAVGLIIAALLASKITFSIFVALFIALLFGGLICIHRNKHRISRVALTVCGSAALFALPWVLIYRENYLTALRLRLHESSAGGPSGGTFGTTGKEIRWLFSSETLFLGDNYWHYMVLIGLLVTGALAAMSLLYRRKCERRTWLALVLFSSSAATVINYFALAYFFGSEEVVRYSSPLLIAVVPLADLIGLALGAESPRNLSPAGRFKMLAITVAAVQIFVLAIFFNTFKDRINRAAEQRTLLSFPVDDLYLEAVENLMGDFGRQKTLTLQSRLEPGQVIMARISTPFHLDFSRNRILTVTEPGLINSWLNLPLDNDAGALHHYLKDRDVRYVMWQHTGGGMKSIDVYGDDLSAGTTLARKIARYNLDFLRALAAMTKTCRIIYDDQETVVFDLGETMR